MPCIFIENLPEGVEWKSDACKRLYREIAEAVGCDIDSVEIHVTNIKYQILGRDGKLYTHGVHVHVEWFAGRSQEVKDLIGEAIHRFLESHNIGLLSDIAIHDYPAGSFYFDGERVDGGPPVPDEDLLAILVRDLGLSEADADLLCYLIRCYHGGGFDLSGSRELYELIKADHPRIHRAFIAYAAGWLTAKGLGWKTIV